MNTVDKKKEERKGSGGKKLYLLLAPPHSTRTKKYIAGRHNALQKLPETKTKDIFHMLPEFV